MEIIKIAPETLEALQNAPRAQPPHPLPMAEAGEAVKDATEVWGYLSAENAPKETRRAFERVCERAGVPYIINKMEHSKRASERACLTRYKRRKARWSESTRSVRP